MIFDFLNADDDDDDDKDGTDDTSCALFSHPFWPSSPPSIPISDLLVQSSTTTTTSSRLYFLPSPFLFSLLSVHYLFLFPLFMSCLCLLVWDTSFLCFSFTHTTTTTTPTTTVVVEAFLSPFSFYFFTSLLNLRHQPHKPDTPGNANTHILLLEPIFTYKALFILMTS